MLNTKKEIIAVLAPVALLLALAVGLMVNAQSDQTTEVTQLISAQFSNQN